MNAQPPIAVLPAWKQIEPAALNGVVLVVGGADTGKSTLCRHLYRRFVEAGRRVAFLDGDPGQSTLGPPTTMTLALSSEGGTSLSQENLWHWFVGSTSPRGHMLPIVTGARRLADLAEEQKAEVVVYDTTGLIDPSQGGLALKIALVDSLRPDAVFAIQQKRELESLVEPLRRKPDLKLYEFPPSPQVVARPRKVRQGLRAEKYREYFQSAEVRQLQWPDYPVWPKPNFQPERLVAFEDRAGYVLGLGIVLEIDARARNLNILSPLDDLSKLVAIRVGNIAVDPSTFHDRML